MSRNRNRKTCMLYNNHRFSVGLAFLGFGLRFCSAIFAVLTLVQIRRSLDRARVVKSESITTTKTDGGEDSSTTATNISLNSSRHPESFTYLNKAYANDSETAADNRMGAYEKSDKLSSEI